MSTVIKKGQKEKKEFVICEIKTAMYQLSTQKRTLSTDGG